MNKKLIIIIVGIIFVISAVSAENQNVLVGGGFSASSDRIIETQNLSSGNSTNITVNITSNVEQAISLQETIPSGWTLTRISDDASSFKSSTNEWVWFSIGAGVTKTIKYQLTVPLNETSGEYYINGTIINASGIIDSVSGNNIVRVMPKMPPSGGGGGGGGGSNLTCAGICHSNYRSVSSDIVTNSLMNFTSQSIHLGIFKEFPDNRTIYNPKIELIYNTSELYSPHTRGAGLFDEFYIKNILATPDYEAFGFLRWNLTNISSSNYTEAVDFANSGVLQDYPGMNIIRSSDSLITTNRTYSTNVTVDVIDNSFGLTVEIPVKDTAPYLNVNITGYTAPALANTKMDNKSIRFDVENGTSFNGTFSFIVFYNVVKLVSDDVEFKPSVFVSRNKLIFSEHINGTVYPNSYNVSYNSRVLNRTAKFSSSSLQNWTTEEFFSKAIELSKQLNTIPKTAQPTNLTCAGMCHTDYEKVNSDIVTNSLMNFSTKSTTLGMFKDSSTTSPWVLNSPFIELKYNVSKLFIPNLRGVGLFDRFTVNHDILSIPDYESLGTLRWNLSNIVDAYNFTTSYDDAYPGIIYDYPGMNIKRSSDYLITTNRTYSTNVSVDVINGSFRLIIEIPLKNATSEMDANILNYSTTPAPSNVSINNKHIKVMFDGGGVPLNGTFNLTVYYNITKFVPYNLEFKPEVIVTRRQMAYSERMNGTIYSNVYNVSYNSRVLDRNGTFASSMLQNWTTEEFTVKKVTLSEFINNVTDIDMRASGNRDIQNQNLTPGSSTNITVNIISNSSQSLSLQEILPIGWTLTRISDDANDFKPSTNEWVWFNASAGVIKTVVYKINVPANATSGIYNIIGNISNSSGVIASITGEKTINVTNESVTPKLKVLISEFPDPVDSGANSLVTVMVTDINGTPISNANVNVSTTGGSLLPITGITDVNGVFTTSYTAPFVVVQTNYTISASTSKIGYISGNGSDIITVRPPIIDIPTTIKIDSGSAPNNGTTTLNITALNATDLTNFNITIKYNASILIVTNASNNPAFGLEDNNLDDASIGFVRISSLNIGSGQNGNVILSTLTVKAVGTSGQTSDLNLTVNRLVDSNLSNIPVKIENGTFTSGLPKNGDINGNGKVTLVDAIYLAKHITGKVGYEIIYADGDINGNGKVTLVDAIYLAKHITGKVGYEIIY